MEEVEVTYEREGKVGNLRIPKEWAKDSKTVRELFWPSKVLQVEELRGRVFWNLETRRK